MIAIILLTWLVVQFIKDLQAPPTPGRTAVLIAWIVGIVLAVLYCVGELHIKCLV